MEGGAEQFINCGMLAGNCMCRIHTDLLQDGAEIVD